MTIKTRLIIAVGVASLACLAQAFQAGYQTEDSTPPPVKEPDYDIRFIINAPYSYCRADGIPESMCGKIGLRLNGTQFQNLNPSTRFNSDYGYNQNNGMVKYNNLLRIISDYSLPPYLYTKGGVGSAMQVPTEGQLVWLFNNGYVPKGGDRTAYWIRQGSAIKVAKIKSGLYSAATNSEATLYRLVTSDVPSACGDGTCKEFQYNGTFRVRFKNLACGLTWGWRVEWRANGRNDGYSGKWAGWYQVPGNYEWVTVKMYSGVSGWAVRSNIQNLDRQTYTADECYALRGNCVNYRISNESCSGF